MAELGRPALSAAKPEVPGIAGSFAGAVFGVRRSRHLLHDYPGRHPNACQDARVEMSKLR